MLSLLFNLYRTMSENFIICYLISTQLFYFLTLYPIGICLSLLILVWILETISIASTILLDYIKELNYYSQWLNIRLLEQYIPNFGIVFKLIDITTNSVYFYSTYAFVFYLKKVGLYLF